MVCFVICEKVSGVFFVWNGLCFFDLGWGYFNGICFVWFCFVFILKSKVENFVDMGDFFVFIVLYFVYFEQFLLIKWIGMGISGNLVGKISVLCLWKWQFEGYCGIVDL